MTAGVVREWRAEEGWGVLDSEETPGGCWAHFSALDMVGYRTLGPGQLVEFSYEAVPQDGYAYRASTVRVTDDVAGTGSNGVVEQGPGYSSTLNIVRDAD